MARALHTCDGMPANSRSARRQSASASSSVLRARRPEPTHAWVALPTEVPLQQAIADLYETFAVYRLRQWTDPCECCHRPEKEARLHAVPLWALTDEDLRDFAFSSMTTWGDARDFKHFLPRIFELAAYGDLDVDLALLGDKLRDAGLPLWSAAEAATITAYWSALLHAVIHRPSHVVDVPTLVCAIANCQDSFAPFAVTWQAALQNPRPRELLGEFIAYEAQGMLRSRTLSDAFFRKSQKHVVEQVLVWLRSESLLTTVCALDTDGEELLYYLQWVA